MKLPLMLMSALALVPTVVLPDQSVLPANSRNNPADLNGTYLCEGTRPDGAEYKGIVRIVRHNGAYQLVWNVGREEQHLGIGILNGDVLAVSYYGGVPGVVAYRIEQAEKGSRLVGQWTVANAGGQVFGETLTRLTQEVTAIPPPPAPSAPAPRPSRAKPSNLFKPA
jgi:hypothetical protein